MHRISLFFFFSVCQFLAMAPGVSLLNFKEIICLQVKEQILKSDKGAKSPTKLLI